MASLLVNNGPEAGKRYELNLPEHVMGRHPECHVVIDVGAVSRYHCKLQKEGDRYLVEDLRSRNGTFVNETAIKGRQQLNPGDQIRVCDVTFTFQDEPKRRPDDSSYRAVIHDDEVGGSTIMSKLDVRSSLSGVHLSATPEARLKALIEITQSLGRALALDQVLPQVLDSLFRIFVQADRGFIGLVDHRGVLVPRWTKLRRENDDDTIRVSRTIARQVMESKGAILSADAASDARFDMSQSIADFRLRSMMCAPLLDSDGNAMGILQVDTLDQRQRFSDEDLEILVSAASQASIAIDNARLHDEALKQRTVERDLILAREVQKAFLPDTAPEVDGYEFFSYYQAAMHIGGDYYDYIRLADGRFAAVVADVVGHGIAAAMLMAKLSADTRFCLASEPDLSKAVAKLNDRICKLQLNRFATFACVVLVPETGEGLVVNAGHLPPLLQSADGSISEIGADASGLPLGILDGNDYRSARFQVAPGDSLLLFTDGITEAANPLGQQFSVDRIRERMQQNRGKMTALGEAVVSAVREHLAGRDQDDDMCLVGIHRVG